MTIVLTVGIRELAIQLDSKQARTSFGRLPLSDEASAPQYGFPQAKKHQTQKVYLGP